MAVLVKDELHIEDIERENFVQGNLSRFSFTMKDEKYILNYLYASKINVYLISNSHYEYMCQELHILTWDESKLTWNHSNLT